MIETCPDHGGQRFRRDDLRNVERCPVRRCRFWVTDEWLAGWGWLWGQA